MRPLTTSELLNAWEAGRGEPPPVRALTLLAAACSDDPGGSLDALSIGQRDARLLTLREWAFGSRFVSVTACPACTERLELAANTSDIRAESPARIAPYAADIDNYRVSFRLPDSTDLMAVATCESIDQAARKLFELCVTRVEAEDGLLLAPGELPASLVDEVTKRMSEADPQADVHFNLTCPACNHAWQAQFDIESFFWTELNTWAQRVLNEVHLLASAYGWSEADILNLTPWRRQFYLNLVS